jgi:hypothetical protein
MVTVYVFALGFRGTTGETEIGEQFFPSVHMSVMTLLLKGILPDNEGFVDGLMQQNVMLGLVGLGFVFISGLTILNLLVGVLCEAVSAVACVEKEQLAAELVKSSLSHILADVDSSVGEDSDRQIALDEFNQLVQRKDFTSAVLNVGVDIQALCGLTDEVFADGKTLSFEEFYKLLLQMRGSNYATVKNVIEIRMDILDLKRNMKEVIQNEMTDTVKSLREL